MRRTYINDTMGPGTGEGKSGNRTDQVPLFPPPAPRPHTKI